MPDVNPYAFRTAVGGFHKGDVTAYISKTAAAHQAEIADLKKQLEVLVQENTALRDQVHLMELPHLLDQHEALQAGTPEAGPETEPVTDASSEPIREEAASVREQELMAYRRAEAAERLAHQRAKKLYANIQAICDESAISLEGAGAVTQEALNIIAQQIQRIQDSFGAVQEDLRSSSESLRTMGEFVPDPAEGLEADL